jgi:hypothetical protein
MLRRNTGRKVCRALQIRLRNGRFIAPRRTGGIYVPPNRSKRNPLQSEASAQYIAQTASDFSDDMYFSISMEFRVTSQILWQQYGGSIDMGA